MKKIIAIIFWIIIYFINIWNTNAQFYNLKTVFESEFLNGSVGWVITDSNASNYMARSYTGGWWGTVQFWPNITTLEPNKQYRVLFRLRTSNNLNDNYFSLIDVWDSTNSYRMYKEIKGTDFNSWNSYQYFHVDFTNQTGSNIEFRVFAYWTQDITVDKVILTDNIYYDWTDNVINNWLNVDYWTLKLWLNESIISQQAYLDWTTFENWIMIFIIVVVGIIRIVLDYKKSK